MERIGATERSDWKRQATELGFDYITVEGKPYWDETAYYRFSLAEIETDLEATTQELIGMCYQAVEHVIGSEALLRRFAIPEFAWDYLRRSWQRQDKDLYGRFGKRHVGLRGSAVGTEWRLPFRRSKKLSQRIELQRWCQRT